LSGKTLSGKTLTGKTLTGWPPPQVGSLPGGRLHLQHGPIDLVIKAEGAPQAVAVAEAAAVARFRTILAELVQELPLLRQPLTGDLPPLAEGPVARRMIAACWPHRHVFITPMAAVAGAVADDMRAAMLAASPDLRTLYVNNGGDIALHVMEKEVLRIGLVPDLAAAMPDGVATVMGGCGVGGIATSGWRGRSFSLGVADAATVLAATAAAADAAATIIANAVNVASPAVIRRPARELDPDSDLGQRSVTTEVGPLTQAEIAHALAAGEERARELLADGLILAAAISLAGEWRIVQGLSGLFLAMA
jgi:uncharacterized protein